MKLSVKALEGKVISSILPVACDAIALDFVISTNENMMLCWRNRAWCLLGFRETLVQCRLDCMLTRMEGYIVYYHIRVFCCKQIVLQLSLQFQRSSDMEIQLALIMQLSDSTKGLHGWFGNIPISSGATAVLVFCGFVSGSVIINVISWMRVFKPWLNHCIPWRIYAYYYLKKAITQRITNHAKALHCNGV